jgi:altronate hydrolase
MTAPLAIRLHPSDNVGIARVDLSPGVDLDVEHVSVTELIPAGHKLALQRISLGEPVRRYGQIIGFASRTIEPGEHVHVHNLKMGDFSRDYAIGSAVKEIDYIRPPATFMGIIRPDGRVATRNYIGVLRL